MSDHSPFRNLRRARAASKLASLALAAAVALSFSGAAALAKSGKAAAYAADPHEYRAFFPSTRGSDRCRPANGAQIMGNFAGADDWIDSVTGELCRR